MSRGEQMTGPRRAATRCDDLVSVPNWNICTPRSRRSVRRRSTKERSSRTTRPGTHMLVDGPQPDGQGIAGSSTRTRHRSTIALRVSGRRAAGFAAVRARAIPSSKRIRARQRD
jgi:hypothetical protein